MIFQNTDTQKQCDPISSKFYHFCSFEPGINQFSVTVWPGSTSVTDSYIIYILNYPFCHSWLIPSVPYMGMGGNYLYPLFYLFAYAFCSLRFFRIKFPIAILVISNFQILNAPFRLLLVSPRALEQLVSLERLTYVAYFVLLTCF